MTDVLEDFVAVSHHENFKLYYRVYHPHLLRHKIPLICVHGIAGNCSDFEYLGTEVDSFCVITPDIAGRGNSDWLNDYKLYNYDTYCSCILQLMQHLAIEKVNFVGTSMGGILGMHLASRAPHAINTLVLNDIGPYMAERPLQVLTQYLLRRPVFGDIAEARTHLEKSLRGFGIDKEEHWDHIVKHYVTPCPGGYTLTFDPKIGTALEQELIPAGYIMDIWHIWNKIQCKTLVLRGEYSNVLTSDILRTMISSKIDVTALELKNTGHAPAFFTSDRIGIIVDWLTSGRLQNAHQSTHR
ncbi:alpha/beta hydrolase [Candidatus Anaplasma sp. TIGMIC]|nr:alpha/beta hydrolase [Candidatus Anaplasma sp. TIGMIC]